MNWRTSITSQNLSQVPSTDTPVKGFFSVQAPKGTLTPQYFFANSASQITKALGTPHKNFPGIKEILDFNSEFSVWVSANPGIGTNYYGGAYFTSSGWIPFYQEQDPTNLSYLASQNFNTSTSSTQGAYGFRTFALSDPWFNAETLADIGAVVNNWKDFTITSTILGSPFTIILKNDATSITSIQSLFSVSNAVAGIYIVSSRNTIPVGYVSLSGTQYSLNFITTSPATSGAWEVIVDSVPTLNIIRNIQELVIFVISQKSQTTYNSTFSVYNPIVSGTPFPSGLVTLEFLEDYIPGRNTVSEGPFTVSVNPDAVDGFNISQFISDVIPSSDGFVNIEVVGNFPTDPTVLTNMGNIYLANPSISVSGTRSIVGANSSDVISAINAGFQAADDNLYVGTKLFVDYLGDVTTNTILALLRGGKHQFATFIQPIGRTSTSISAIETDRNNYANSEGFAYTANEFLVKEAYNMTKFYSPEVGNYARKLARAVRDIYGGWATMYYDTNGLGGELGDSVQGAKYSIADADLQTMDGLGINPMIIDPIAGPMVVSQRSGANPASLSDLSWLGHSMAFDLLKEQILNGVMLQQIGKPNDAFWQGLRTQQVNDIIAPRLTTNVFAGAQVAVSSLNTPAVMAQRQFIIGVAVKVTPFSEYINLQFVNVGQSASVTVF